MDGQELEEIMKKLKTGSLIVIIGMVTIIDAVCCGIITTAEIIKKEAKHCLASLK